MPRYMGWHTFPKNAFTYDQVCQLGEAAQRDAAVKGYRSFISPSQGRAVCIMDAENQQAVEAWFRKMNLPTDAVVEVEIEGDHAQVQDLTHAAAGT